MEKANVMESGILWREEVQWVHDNEYPDVELSHMYADAGAMQLCRWPKQFDVIVTDNLFGDLLSDAAAMLTGSLGMLPSASLGAPMANGRPKALYEPVHGSAPDIAGQGKANPIACVLSFAMALRYSFDNGEEAKRLEDAIEKVLADGARTADLLGEDGVTPVSTSEMGDKIIEALENEQQKVDIPGFGPGDTVVVQVKVREGSRERLQAFEGVVIGKRNRGLNSAFTVRKVSHGVGVERTFQTHSPLIDSIELKRRGDVRKAKLYYLRDRSGRAARIREKV